MPPEKRSDRKTMAVCAKSAVMTMVTVVTTAERQVSTIAGLGFQGLDSKAWIPRFEPIWLRFVCADFEPRIDPEWGPACVRSCLL